MYVLPPARGRGLGRIILEFLEHLARGEGLRLLRLESGVCQVEALRLYRAAGFRDVGPFEGYEADPNSLFLEKRLQGQDP
jgi:putative acetyltransferase